MFHLYLCLFLFKYLILEKPSISDKKNSVSKEEVTSSRKSKIPNLLRFNYIFHFQVLFYVEDAEETMNVQKALLEMIDIYRKEQGAKFIGLSSDEDDKSNDLVGFFVFFLNQF